MKTLNRKIEFYWTDVKPSTLNKKFTEIGQLSLSLKDKKNSFFPISPGEIYLSMRFPKDCPKRANLASTFGTLCYVRKSNLPHIDNKGIENEILLSDDANGLLEKAHFFTAPLTINESKGTLLLMETSRVAPGITMFFKYLCDGYSMQDLKIYRLVKKNVFDELAGSKGISQIDIEIERNMANALYPKPNALSKLFSGLEAAKAHTFRLVLSTRVKQGMLDDETSDNILALAKHWGRSMFKKARIKYVSSEGRIAFLDLLEGNIDAKVSVNTEEKNNRYLNSKSMFNKLLSLYDQKKNILSQSDAILIFQRQQEVKNDDEPDQKM